MTPPKDFSSNKKRGTVAYRATLKMLAGVLFPVGEGAGAGPSGAGGGSELRLDELEAAVRALATGFGEFVAATKRAGDGSGAGFEREKEHEKDAGDPLLGKDLLAEAGVKLGMGTAGAGSTFGTPKNGGKKPRSLQLHHTDKLAEKLTGQVWASYASMTNHATARPCHNMRNQRERLTLARMVDLLEDQLGRAGMLELDAVEVAARRYWAIGLADQAQHEGTKDPWAVASELEEVPMHDGIGDPAMLKQALKSYATKKGVRSGTSGKAE
jgi:hypothetical protein